MAELEGLYNTLDLPSKSILLNTLNALQSERLSPDSLWRASWTPLHFWLREHVAEGQLVGCYTNTLPILPLLLCGLFVSWPYNRQHKHNRVIPTQDASEVHRNACNSPHNLILPPVSVGSRGHIDERSASCPSGGVNPVRLPPGCHVSATCRAVGGHGVGPFLRFSPPKRRPVALGVFCAVAPQNCEWGGGLIGSLGFRGNSCV